MKLPTISVAFKDTKSKSGLSPVIINVTFNRTNIPVTTGFKVKKENFRNGRIIGDNAPYKNRIINGWMNKNT